MTWLLASFDEIDELESIKHEVENVTGQKIFSLKRSKKLSKESEGTNFIHPRQVIAIFVPSLWYSICRYNFEFLSYCASFSEVSNEKREEIMALHAANEARLIQDETAEKGKVILRTSYIPTVRFR